MVWVRRFIVSMRERLQPEASGRGQNRERESKLTMASRLGMTNRSRAQSREEQSRKESTGEQRERRRGTERS